MECQKFNESLQSVLDGNMETLPAAAQRHIQNCENCRLLYSQLLELRKAVQDAPKPELSPRAETLIARSITNRIRSSLASQSHSVWQNLSDTITAIRWQRVLFASAPIAIGIILILQVFTTTVPEPTNLQVENDIEILLEEHTIAMENGIFHSTSQYANLITITETEQ